VSVAGAFAKAIAGADRVVPENDGWRLRRNRDEGLGPAAVVVLSRVTAQIFIQRGHTAVEASAVVMARQRLLAPHKGRAHTR